MSLFWNWTTRNILRRCTPFHSTPKLEVVASSKYLTTSSTSATLLTPSRTLSSSNPLPFYTQLTLLRFKSGIKTNSGCKKRFRVRKSGSIKRPKAGKSHNTGYLRRQRANRLGHSTGIEGKKIEQRVRKLLGVYNA